VTDLIASDTAFPPADRELLALLAETMIPATDALPAASDPVILQDILAVLSANAGLVTSGLAIVRQHMPAGLTMGKRLETVESIREAAREFIAVFQDAVVTCYYRDDRVLLHHGLPARAPFPDGNPVPATDWGLLERVRARAPFYREAPDD